MNYLTKISDSLRNSYWLLSVGFVVVLGIAAAHHRARTRLSEWVIRIQPIGKEDRRLIVAEDVKALLQKSFIEDINTLDISQIKTQRIEAVLERHPFVENAEVWIDANNALHIYIHQREPILRIIDNNGLNYYLDAWGHRMPVSSNATARVPVATGELPPFFEEFVRTDNRLRQVFEVARMIRANATLRALVAQIDVLKNGDIVLIPEIGHFRIVLGDASDLKDKFARLLIFLREGLPYEGWRKYREINLKFTNQVVCTRR